MPSIAGFSNYFANIFSGNTPGSETRAPVRRAAPVRKTQGKQKVPVQTKREAIAATAKRVAAQNRQNSGAFGTSLLAGVRRGAFGIPERLAAGGLWLTQDGETSYGDILDLVRATTDEEMNQSVTGNVLGQIIGGGAAGSAAAKGIGLAATKIAPRAGQALTALTTLKRGQTGRNAAKLATVGGASGAAQAVGEGSDPVRGAAYGAVAAPLLVGGGKAAEFLTRPVRDFIGASSAKGILRRYTTTTAEEMTERAADFRAKTGAEPTVFEILPLEDRQSIQKAVGLLPPKAREKLAGLVRERASNIGPELAKTVEGATSKSQQGTVRYLAGRLAESRGTQSVSPDDLKLAQRAARSPVDMEEFGRVEANNIMAPIEKVKLFDDVRQLFPTEPQNQAGTIVDVISDREAVAAIRNAAGRLKTNITGGDITKIIRRLESVPPTSTEAGAAERALDAIYTKLDEAGPTYRPIVEKMRSRFAEVQRMREGINEGMRQRTRESIPINDREGARAVRNAYDTNEGVRGIMAGQASRLASDVSGTPAAATRAVQDIAESPATQEAIARNLGPGARDTIVDAADAQGESARRLAALASEKSGQGDAFDLSEITRSLVALSPSALPSTKFWAIARLQRNFSLPKKQSEKIVDSLFSQDPAKINRALALLDNAGDTGKAFLRQLRTAVVGGVLGNEAGQGLGDVSESTNAPVEAPAAPAEFPDDLTGLSDEELLALDQEYSGEFPEDLSTLSDEELLQLDQEYEQPFGVSAVKAVFPDAEITDDLRNPNSDLGRSNLSSYHVRTDGAVDVRPIPGMTFDEFVQRLKDAGYNVVEAIDEVKNPSKHATGPHWHVAFG